MESNRYILNNDTPVEDLGGGVSRQLLGYNNQLMMVKVSFLTGAVGALHTHMHSQTTYCASGVFKFTIEEENRTVCEGDATYIPPGVIHGVLCLEEGVLIDTFNPVRQDFLK